MDDIERVYVPTEVTKISEKERCIRIWMKIAITIMSILCSLMMLGLIILVTKPKIIAEPPPHLCLTQTCINDANRILTNMNEKVNPCENFYQFVCGKYSKHNVLQDDESFININSKLKDSVKKHFKFILEGEIQPNEIKPLTQAKILYNSCMTVETSKKKFDSILRLFGGWPLVEGDKWNADNFSWMNVTLELKKMREPSNLLIDIFSRNYSKYNLEAQLYVLPPQPLFLSYKYLSSQDYIDYTVDVAAMYGIEKEVVTTELTKSLHFEQKLSEYNFKELKVYTNNSSSKLGEYHQDYTSNISQVIPWKEFLQNFTETKLDKYNYTTIDLNYTKYLEHLLNTTPKRTVANYMIWKLINHHIEFITKRGLFGGYEHSNIYKFEMTTSRWEKCVHDCTNYLFPIVSSTYIKRYITDDIEKAVKEIIKNVKEEFIGFFKKMDWMDSETKTLAIEKIELMKDYFYPNEILNNTKLENIYNNLNLTNDYYQNIRELKLFKKQLSQDLFLDNPFKFPNNWELYSFNEFLILLNLLSENKIKIGVPYFDQGPLFSINRPKYLNYGAIGSVIGHEIAHGFGKYGSNFDKNGDNNSWWSNTTIDLFSNISNCFINQYNSYNINGTITLEENIADVEGLRGSYYAYQNLISKSSIIEPLLPGLNYTRNQMFWISAAASWCSEEQDDFKKLHLNDSHSPDDIRVIGPFTNIPEFSNDFNCPHNSTMNPEKKCKMW